jgi:hypothetical protein
MYYYSVHPIFEILSFLERLEKVYISCGPEFGVTLCGRNLIVVKSFYGLEIYRKITRISSRFLTMISF